jgi:hypothetical protein
VHHHPGGLVDDDQPFVLMDDLERQRLGAGRRRLRLGLVDRDPLARLEPGRRPAGVPLDLDPALLDELLQAGPAQLWKPGRQPAVETETLGCGLD